LGWVRLQDRQEAAGILYSPAGLYLGTHPTYELGVPRLERVAARIMRGLYYKWTDHPVPWTHDADIFAFERIRRLPKETRDGVGPVLGLVMQAPAVTIGDRVCRYHLRSFPGDPAGVIVALVFYEAMAFLGWVLAREEDGPIQAVA
jgi:hypothetical protein